jgi:ADP-heptose:LPS heptosyltransferase
VCDASLVRLVGSVSVADHILTPDQADEAFEFDAHCPMMSLPGAFGSRLETIPNDAPYVSIPPPLVAAWRERLADERPKVGIAWAGNWTLRYDARRSIPLAQFAPLMARGGLRFISLQKGVAAEEWHKLVRDGGDCIDACTDFFDTAALISSLDLVISVDTAVAHLAGALGRPVWLLNRFGSEWRWGRDATRTPWYPSMRIFNQRQPGDWSDVIARIGFGLGTFACEENRS